MYKEYEKILKDMEKEHITVLDLEVYFTLNTILNYKEVKVNKEQFDELFGVIRHAYLKADNINLDYIVMASIDNLDNLKDMSTWELLDKALEYSAM